MPKTAHLLLLFVFLGLVFAGAVSAQENEIDEAPTIDVTVVDSESGENVTVACPGEEFWIHVTASANDQYIPEPMALIKIDPESGLTLDTENAAMWNGTEWISNNDSVSGGFLTWSGQHNAYFWAIMQGFGPMQPQDVAELFIPAIIADNGEITVNVTFEDAIIDGTFFPAEDSYTLLSVPCHPGYQPCQAETVPMQPTGSPLALAALGLLGIITGAIYGKLE